MKVRVALFYDELGEEMYDTIVDLGKYDRDRHRWIEDYEEEASQIIRDAMKNWQIFPGAIITITAPDEKEAACYSSSHGYVE